jgi:hypothetical protein
MRNAFVVLLVAFGLSGCGESQTPLKHALNAFRDGDHTEFLAAKSEAQAALKTALQPGGDLCLTTMMDVEKYGAVAVIEKLDKPDLFASTEDKRLVYALKLAGKHLVIEPGSFLSQSPLVLALSDPHNAPSCAGEKDKQMSAMMGAGPEAQDANEARMVMLRDWMRDLKSKYGSDFETHMHNAAASLENSGYSTGWPVEVDFIE